MGVSARTIVRWEEDEFDPTSENLYNLVRALKTTFAYLTGKSNEWAIYSDIDPKERTQEQWREYHKQKIDAETQKFRHKNNFYTNRFLAVLNLETNPLVEIYACFPGVTKFV